MGQKNQLWWDLPAADSFQLHREIYSLPKAEFDKTLAELTGLLGVEKLTSQAVRELSLGERMKMELIAALLHQPRLLLLDEPTIGLDVVAQVAIQKCLRDYHARRGVTMLLTSHYMRDVEALCDRVLVITNGMLVYDGPLSGIADMFGRSKLVRLQFASGIPDDIERFGEVTRREGPTADLKVDRSKVAEILASDPLDLHAVDDVSVTDPPLEQHHRPGLRGGTSRPSMMPPETELATAPSNVLPVDVFDDHEPSPIREPGRGPIATTKKYSNILRASLKERMAYRGDFLLGTILRSSCRWSRPSSSGGRSTQDRGQSSLAGVRLLAVEMIAYLLLVHISRMFSSMPNLAGRDRPGYPRGDA